MQVSPRSGGEDKCLREAGEEGSGTDTGMCQQGHL